ncbi:hypothetical protein ABEX25_15905 [Paenibacillus thiaminolyticus]|uniref:hypothetical protein n=1 Tax=Paenibacillus thiaminolyticus TaxID=49283 RepID=UPI003D2E898C
MDEFTRFIHTILQGAAGSREGKCSGCTGLDIRDVNILYQYVSVVRRFSFYSPIIRKIGGGLVNIHSEEWRSTMAQIQPIVRIEIDPTKPVPEICAVISAVAPYHPGQEEIILMGIQEAIG